MSWPDVGVSAWAPTKRSLHLYAQMLGKMRVRLSPAQPNWMFTALQLGARGLTTGPIPWNDTAFAATLDVFSSEIIIESSSGATQRVALVPARTVAAVYRGLQDALESLGIDCYISPIPQELADTTPMHEDERPAAYDPAAVQRWFAAATATAGIFDRWRSHFFGRTAIAVWWGALDIALLLFSGKHAPAPSDRGYLMKYDLDAELMNVGLYYGDENVPPFYYGYIFPQPTAAPGAGIAPAEASWSSALGEWTLPYEIVRGAEHPDALLTAFLDAIYAQCIAAGWDQSAYQYARPPRATR